MVGDDKVCVACLVAALCTSASSLIQRPYILNTEGETKRVSSTIALF